MTPAIIIGAAIVMFVLLSTRKKKAKDKPPQSGWRITYSPGMPDRPTPQGAGWYFDFPTRRDHHVHYVQKFPAPRLVVGKTLVAKFTITGGGFVPQEFPDGRPATVTLIIQRKGDDWSAKGPMQSYRWYSSQMIELRAGTFELAVPLTCLDFGDVYGGHDPHEFAAALLQTENIGLVFGSAVGRGHGVYATGPTTVELVALEVPALWQKESQVEAHDDLDAPGENELRSLEKERGVKVNYKESE